MHKSIGACNYELLLAVKMSIPDIDNISTINDMEPYRQAGRRDRATGLPPSNAAHPMGEVLRIINDSKTQLTVQMASWQETHRQVLDKVASIKHRITEFGLQTDFAVRSKEKKAQLLQSSNPQWGRSPLMLATDERDEAKAALDIVQAQENGRQLHSHLGPEAYFLAMAGLAVLELPINIEAAGALFPEGADLMVWILAAIVGILLVAFAHTLGRFIKQRTVLGLPRRLDRIMQVIALLMSVGAIAALFFMRWRWTEILKTQNDGELLFFLFLNASVFFFGLLTAVLHYDSNPQYQSSHTVYRKSEAKLRKLERQLQQEKLVLDQDFASMRNAQFRRHEQLKGELAQAEMGLDRSFNEWLSILLQGCNLLTIRLTAYAQGNQEADGNAVPQWLSQNGIDQIATDIYDHFKAEALKCA